MPDIPDLDARVGLRRAAGKQALYLKLLHSFAADYGDGLDMHFAEWLNADHWEDASRYAHTFAGLAGTIGATNIQQLGQALEATCAQRNREACHAALQRLEPALRALVSALNSYLLTADPVDGRRTRAEITPGIVPDCLPRLRLLLREGDSQVIDLWRVHAPAFASILKPLDVQRVEHALSRFDFDAALDVLADLPATEHG